MSAALDKKLRRKANRQLRKLGEREVTAQDQRYAQGKINMLLNCNKLIDEGTPGEAAQARKAKKATTVRWEKRNNTNVKEWFNPTGKQYVR